MDGGSRVQVCFLLIIVLSLVVMAQLLLVVLFVSPSSQCRTT